MSLTITEGDGIKGKTYVISNTYKDFEIHIRAEKMKYCETSGYRFIVYADKYGEKTLMETKSSHWENTKLIIYTPSIKIIKNISSNLESFLNDVNKIVSEMNSPDCGSSSDDNW